MEDGVREQSRAEQRGVYYGVRMLVCRGHWRCSNIIWHWRCECVQSIDAANCWSAATSRSTDVLLIIFIIINTEYSYDNTSTSSMYECHCYCYGQITAKHRSTTARTRPSSWCHRLTLSPLTGRIRSGRAQATGIPPARLACPRRRTKKKFVIAIRQPAPPPTTHNRRSDCHELKCVISVARIITGIITHPGGFINFFFRRTAFPASFAVIFICG